MSFEGQQPRKKKRRKPLSTQETTPAPEPVQEEEEASTPTTAPPEEPQQEEEEASTPTTVPPEVEEAELDAKDAELESKLADLGVTDDEEDNGVLAQPRESIPDTLPTPTVKDLPEDPGGLLAINPDLLQETQQQQPEPSKLLPWELELQMCLDTIDSYQEVKVQQLAQYTKLNEKYAKSLLDRYVEQGLVVRNWKQAAGHYSLTNQGLARLQELRNS
jgi:predicted transcriptional regulator